MIDDENEGLSDKYITESKDKNECIQSSIDYTGINVKLLQIKKMQLIN
jgi:hypothetical protein